MEIREKLKAKLTDEQDPAMILHLSITLLFYAIHAGRFVHAPGKAVPALIKYLSKTLPSHINQRLHEMQGECKCSNQTNKKIILFFIDFVIQQSTGGATSAELSNDKIDFIKKLGLTAKENMSFTSFSTDTNETQ